MCCTNKCLAGVCHLHVSNASATLVLSPEESIFRAALEGVQGLGLGPLEEEEEAEEEEDEEEEEAVSVRSSEVWYIWTTRSRSCC